MSAHLFPRVEPISKKARVVNLMKDAILAGRIEPGSPIVEGKIAQQLGVGQPLVREALIELEHHGFVQRVPYSGTRVTLLSHDEIDQIYRVRIELEALAAALAQEHGTAADRAELRALVERMKAAARAGDRDRFFESDLAFHRKLWEASANRFLASTLERLVVPLFAFFLMKTARNRSAFIASAARHERICKALERRDPEALRALVARSLSHLKEDLLTNLLGAKEE